MFLYLTIHTYINICGFFHMLIRFPNLRILFYCSRDFCDKQFSICEIHSQRIIYNLFKFQYQHSWDTHEAHSSANWICMWILETICSHLMCVHEIRKLLILLCIRSGKLGCLCAKQTTSTELIPFPSGIDHVVCDYALCKSPLPTAPRPASTKCEELNHEGMFDDCVDSKSTTRACLTWCITSQDRGNISANHFVWLYAQRTAYTDLCARAVWNERICDRRHLLNDQ